MQIPTTGTHTHQIKLSDDNIASNHSGTNFVYKLSLDFSDNFSIDIPRIRLYCIYIHILFSLLRKLKRHFHTFLTQLQFNAIEFI